MRHSKLFPDACICKFICWSYWWGLLPTRTFCNWYSISFSFVASYASTLQTNWRREKLRWNPTGHMRLSPELNLKQKFTLNHVQLMKLLPMLTIKLNAINFVIFVCGLYTVVSLNCCSVVNDQYLHVLVNQFSTDSIWLTDVLVELPWRTCDFLPGIKHQRLLSEVYH